MSFKGQNKKEMDEVEIEKKLGSVAFVTFLADHPAESKDMTGGRITCEEFLDVNGKRYEGWIPAIRLVGEGE